MPIFGRGGPEFAYKAKYLGGHSAFPKSMDVHLNLMPENLVIPEFPLEISYGKIKNVQGMTQEKLTATRLFLLGLFAFALKKKKLYMVLTYEDEVGIEHNPVFDLKKIEEVQPVIYQRMINARKQQ